MVDKTARVIAVLSLCISVIFPLATLYYSYWRPPFMVVEIGRDLLIEQTTGLGPRFGLNSGFINQGAKGTILTFFSLSFDSPPQELDLNAMSKSLAEWKEHEGKFLPAPGSYELVGPVVVKGGDAASATLWFIPNKRFELTPGNHLLTLRASSADGEWRRSFHIYIAPEKIAAMQKNPYSDYDFPISKE